MPIQTKEINLIDAKNSSPGNIKEIPNPDSFYEELTLHNISDLQNVDIKKDGQKYIFAINGADIFTILGEQKFEDCVQNFYEKQKNSEQNVFVDAADLKLQIFFGNDPLLEKKAKEAREHRENSIDFTNISERTAALKEFFDAQTDEAKRNAFWLNPKYSKYEKANWKLQKSQAKERLQELKRIEKELSRIEHGRYENTDINTYDSNITLKQIADQLDVLEQQAPNFITNRNEFLSKNSDTTPYFPTRITSKSQAKAILNALKQHNKDFKKIDTVALGAAEQQELARDLEELKTYLEKVVDGPDTFNPDDIPFTASHKRAYDKLLTIDPTLQTLFPEDKNQKKINNQVNATGITNEGDIGGTSADKNKTESTTGNTQEAKSEATDGISAVRDGGLYGGLNYLTRNFQDKSERGQQFYKSFGNIALLAGGIFLGVKALKSTWRLITGKSKEEKTLGKDLGRLGGIAGGLLLTAGRPQDLFKGGYSSEKIADLLSWIGIGKGKEGKENNTNTNSSSEILRAATGAMSLFAGKSYEDMKNLVEKNDGKIRIKGDIYDQRLTAAKETEKNTALTTPDQQAKAAAQRKFLESIGKNDSKGILDLAFTSMGISWEDLNNPDKAKETFDNNADTFIQRAVELSMFMDQYNYEKTNADLNDRIKKYMKEGTPSLEELKAEGVFEKKIDLDPEIKNALKGQVDVLNITDPEKKQNFLEAFYQFYQDLPTPKPQISLEKDSKGNILLSTYGEKTPLTLDKTLTGLPLTFDSTKETLRVANLTNKIKNLSRNLEPASKDKQPFYLDATGEITVNNTPIYKLWQQDLTLISKEGLKDISQKLTDKQNKGTYVNYLNGLQHWVNGSHHQETVIIPTGVVVASTLDNDSESDSNNNASESLSEEKTKELENHLKTLDNLSDDISKGEKEKIKTAFTDFYNNLGKDLIPPMTMRLDTTTKNVILNTYGLDSTLDFVNKKIRTGGRELPITLSYEELFNVANLTNNILTITKNKDSNGDYSPFTRQSEVAPLGIKFNDTELLTLGFDTRIISGSGLSSLSEALSRSGNVDYYVEHLNDLWLNQRVNGLPTLIEQAKVNRKDVMAGYKLFLETREKDRPLDKTAEFNGKKMKTRGYSTEINLEDTSVFGLTSINTTEKSAAEAYRDLFILTDLINLAKSETVKKGAGSDEPFNVSATSNEIEFDDVGRTTDDIVLKSEIADLDSNFDDYSYRKALVNKLNARWANGHKKE